MTVQTATTMKMRIASSSVDVGSFFKTKTKVRPNVVLLLLFNITSVILTTVHEVAGAFAPDWPKTVHAWLVRQMPVVFGFGSAVAEQLVDRQWDSIVVVHTLTEQQLDQSLDTDLLA